MAPWQVAVCVINPRKDAAVSDAAAELYRELADAGLDVVLDDRGLRPGAMFADIELIGIPHRAVVSERGLAAGTFEYRHRRARESENLDPAALLAKVHAASSARRTAPRAALTWHASRTTRANAPGKGGRDP